MGLKVETAGRRRGRVEVGVDTEVPQDLRKSRALKVGELAERSGVSHDTFTRLEGGHRTAKPSTGRRLASALGVEPGELVQDGRDR